MFENTHATFAQHGQIDPKTFIGRLGARDRLKKQIEGCAAIQAFELSCHVRQATALGWNRELRNQPIERSQDGGYTRDRIRRRIYSDDRVSASVEQAVKRGQQNACNVIGWMIGLQANREYAGFAEGVSTTRNVSYFVSREHQILVAHQLCYGGRHFGRNTPFEGL